MTPKEVSQQADNPQGNLPDGRSDEMQVSASNGIGTNPSTHEREATSSDAQTKETIPAQSEAPQESQATDSDDDEEGKPVFVIEFPRDEMHEAYLAKLGYRNNLGTRHLPKKYLPVEGCVVCQAFGRQCLKHKMAVEADDSDDLKITGDLDAVVLKDDDKEKTHGNLTP